MVRSAIFGRNRRLVNASWKTAQGKPWAVFLYLFSFAPPSQSLYLLYMTTTTEGLLERLVRSELRRAMAPVTDALIKMQGGKVSPEAAEVATPAPVRRGRPASAVKREKPVSAAPAKANKKAGKKSPSAGTACAVIGCDKPARSRGLCAVHYQKMRNLLKRDELPQAWRKDSHEPQSLQDIKLRRGRPGKAEVEVAAAPAETLAESEEQPAIVMPGPGRPLAEWLANAGA